MTTHVTPPDFEAAREHVLREVVRFTRVLRREGASVPANAALPAVEALVRVGLDDRRRVQAALRATLVADPRDRELLDDHFGEFWYRLRTGLEATAAVDDSDADGARGDDESRSEIEVEGATDTVDDDATAENERLDADEAAVRSRQVAESSDEEPDERTTTERPGTYSTVGSRDAADGETNDRTVSQDAMRRFERALATLSGRRWARVRSGEAVDARRALRESLDTGGVAMTLPTRTREPTAFRACVLVDVSQSVLDAIDRGFLLSVLEALVADSRSVRVFFFDTDIREVTHVFENAEGDPATALERAEISWGGGTRIGASLETLRRQWPHAVGRRTATIVISDGLDVGDIETLESEMSWLARRSRAVIWLNPLAATRGYEPTCRGMATALPYVDGLFAFAGPADVAEIARQLERHGVGGPVGYEHDFRDRSAETAP